MALCFSVGILERVIMIKLLGVGLGHRMVDAYI